MERYVAGEHAASLARLTEWVDAAAASAEPALCDLAYAAVRRIAQGASDASADEHDAALAIDAAALAERLRAFAPHARAAPSE
jgi:hypothetical protein